MSNKQDSVKWAKHRGSMSEGIGQVFDVKHWCEPLITRLFVQTDD